MKSNVHSQELQTDKAAAIGIGAMIVFIALILVAAVAAAVIIQTAEALQQNAQQTGDDTADNMAGKIMINAAYVDANGYNLFVRLAPGSEPAPTNTISYQLMCGGAAVVEGTVGNTVLMDGTGGAAATMQPATGYTMLIAGAAGGNDCTAATLGSGSNVQMYIHVGSGGTTFETLSVQETATGSKVV